MRALALVSALLLASAALADPPTDGGVPADAAPPPADTAPPPADAAPPPADAAPAAASLPPVGAPPKVAPDPYALLGAAPPPQPDAPPHARPTPLLRSALFWTSVIFGAGAVAAIAVGVGLAATFHPRYALISF